MEYSEPEQWHQRPEFDRSRPGGLFTYAKEKVQYLRERVEEYHLPGSVEHLSEELEEYISTTFETMPVVTVVGNDIFYTSDIQELGPDRLLEFKQLPLSGDAEVLHTHTINGLLYGFHKGENDDLRAYVSINDGVRKVMGGIYTPLLSVGVETNDIQLAEYSAEEELDRIDMEIRRCLETYDVPITVDVTELLSYIDESKATAARILYDVSPAVAKIARYEQVTPQFVDMIFEYIKYKLRLHFPHDINVSSYREVITKKPTPAYRPLNEPKQFVGITPELELIGESANKSLGLLFINDDKAVQIPVQYITSIYRTQ